MEIKDKLKKVKEIFAKYNIVSVNMTIDDLAKEIVIQTETDDLRKQDALWDELTF